MDFDNITENQVERMKEEFKVAYLPALTVNTRSHRGSILFSVLVVVYQGISTRDL